MKPAVYKLKDFARITNLSRKALLLYEKKGLLLPEWVDDETGYRYYNHRQVRRASKIAFLRNMDIPLDLIASILDSKLTLKQYFESNRMRLELIKRQIKIDHGFKTMQVCEYNETFMNATISTTVVPQMIGLTLEGRGSVKDISLHFSLLQRFMKQYAISSCGPSNTFYFRDSDPGKHHFKVCYPVQNYIAIQHPDIRCEIIPSVKIAYMYHFGDYETLPITWRELISEIKSRNWQCQGDYLETYIITGDKRYTDSSSFVTSVAGIIE